MTASESTKPGRQAVFRLLAVLFGLSLFVVAESLLATFDIGRTADHDDPYVDFDDVDPLFVLNRSQARLEIPRTRQKFFAPESFPQTKGPKTFRIFCLGGSTVQGRPYSHETSFPTWLRMSLSAANPKQNWEVINCGGISYASYRVTSILEEILAYEPDLVILCSGHNEFLEERTYAQVRQAPGALISAHRLAANLRSYSLMKTAYQSLTAGPPTPDKPRLTAEANALLDYEDGLKAYHRDNEFRSNVIAHYVHNIRRMIAMAKLAEVPLLLIRPPSNLRDCPPFKSQHRDGLSSTGLSRWQERIKEAKEQYRNDLHQSIALFEQALAIDDEYAVTHYELGRCLLLTGDPDRALQSFLRAREHDICPLRMIAPLEEALSKAATETDTPVIDAHALLARECRDGILGDEILVDHVHPKYRGHQLIANALTDQLIEQGVLGPTQAGWREQRDELYRQHFESLDDIYFARGLRELKALRAWAAGRAEAPTNE